MPPLRGARETAAIVGFVRLLYRAHVAKSGREAVKCADFSPARYAFWRFCACNSAPENPVDATIVSPPTLTATPPPRVTHEGSRIGAVFLPVAPGSATALKINSDRGLIVSTVVAGGAAAKAGIVKGDLLLSVDGTPVSSLADLTAAVNAAAPHHSGQFGMSRDGVARDVTIPL